jgi:hypothetical protein
MSAFFTEGRPCESCGKPCDELHIPYWAPDLRVGDCCAIHSDEVPGDGLEAPPCQELCELVKRCKSVPEVSAAFQAHFKTGCLICCSVRKPASSEATESKEERRAA